MLLTKNLRSTDERSLYENKNVSSDLMSIEWSHIPLLHEAVNVEMNVEEKRKHVAIVYNFI